MKRIVCEDGKLWLHSHFPDDLAKIRALPTAYWRARRKVWEVPATPAMYESVRRAFPDAPEEGCAELQRKARERLRALRIGECPKRYLAVQYRAETKPWDHQRRMTAVLLHADVTLLDCWMGTGKTKAVLDTLATREAHPALVLCPCPAIDVWREQAELHAPNDIEVLALDSGSTKEKAQRIEKRLETSPKQLLVVLNYESAIWPHPKKLLKKVPWDTVIFDEIHRIKAPNGKASWLCASLKADRRIGLTGTVMPHSPLDVYAQYRALDPGIFGLSFTKFRARYAVLGGWGQFAGKLVIDFKNQGDLRRNMDRIRVHVPGDVLDLPELQTVDRRFDLSPAERQVYDELEENFITWFENGEQITAANVLVKLLKLQEITSGFAFPEDSETPIQCGTSKADIFEDLIEDLPEHEPLVVFARFRHDIDTIRERCEKTDRSVSLLAGGINQVPQWRRGDTDILVAQVQAGSLAINLTRSRYAVFYSLGYSLGDYQQAMARIHRPGQERTTFVYRLVARGTVDAKIIAALDKRRGVIDHIKNMLLTDRAANSIVED